MSASVTKQMCVCFGLCADAGLCWCPLEPAGILKSAEEEEEGEEERTQGVNTDTSHSVMCVNKHFTSGVTSATHSVLLRFRKRAGLSLKQDDVCLVL